MKRNLKKVVAAALAMTMCVPACAFAADTSGSFDTSFDIYSPVLTISVPTALDIEINPIADSSATGVKKFTVASNSIDIMNASVDVEKDVPIPVNVTVKASIASKKDDVITEYNTFTADNKSTKKRIHLKLSEAGTAAVMGVKTSGAAAFDTDKKLDLSQYEVTTAAIYSGSNSTPITQYGSLLSMDVAGPATTNTTTGATYSTTAGDVTAKVASFAVTGEANTNADWKADDISVAVSYNVKASQSLSITTPTVSGATITQGAADVTYSIPNVGEATVIAMALHNEKEEGFYGDFVFDDAAYTVDYAPNASTSTQTDATITIPKDNETLSFLAGEEYDGKAQDIVIALSDGRYVVSTLTVNAPTTP